MRGSGAPGMGQVWFRGLLGGFGLSLEWRGGIFGGPWSILGSLRQSLGLLGDPWNEGCPGVFWDVLRVVLKYWVGGCLCGLGRPWNYGFRGFLEVF